MIRNFFWILISIVLAPVFYCRILLRRLFVKNKSKILVIVTGKIGDMVCASPIFREIKKNFPDFYLVAAVREHSYGAIKNNPNIDKFIFLYSKRYQGFLGMIKLIKMISEERFYWSVNISPNSLATLLPYWSGIPNRITSTSKLAGRASKIVPIFCNYKLEYKQRTLKLRHNLELLKFLGIRNFDEKKEVFITKQEEDKATEFLNKNNLKEKDFIIGISVTAGRKIKEWEPINFGKLADKLIKDLKAKVIFFGAPSDINVLEKAANSMKNKAILSIDFQVHELAAILKRIKLFISGDTGPLYIAHAIGVPVVDIVGPIDATEQPPRDEISEIVQKNIYCVPCSFLIPAMVKCKEGHHRCLKETTVDDVVKSVKRLINRVYNK